MDYTLGDKAIALLDCTLWWRFPNCDDESAKNWTRVTDDIVRPDREDISMTDAEYHIGDEPPKPPRVLSELERELLEALEEADEDFASEGFGIDGPYRAPIRAAIAKAKGEA